MSLCIDLFTNFSFFSWLHKMDQLDEVYGWISTIQQFVMKLQLWGAACEWYDGRSR